MPLVIPLKSTIDIDLVKPVSSYLRNTYSDLGSDASLAMARALDSKRRLACIKALDKNESSLAVLMQYHDQLVNISGKIPFTVTGCAVKFTWRDPFTSNKSILSSSKITMCSGEFELMCVRWNVAALMCQVGAGQDDSDTGIQAATKYFQQSAGLFFHIQEYISGILNKEIPTSDLSPSNLHILGQYMVACAQEAIYTKAKSGKMKQKTLAQVCRQCHVLYSDVSKSADKVSKDLLNYSKIKAQYFKANTEWHQALQCKDDKKYGEMIARLQSAAAILKLIIKDAPKHKPLYEQIQKELKDVEKENNFIYHDPVPSKDKLDAIKPAIVAKPTVYARNHLLLEGNITDIFEAVVPLQVQEASVVFEQKKKEKIDQEIARVRELTTVLNGAMRSMHLPEAIETTTGSGVPPSIIQKAAEIRVKGGYDCMNNLAMSIPESLRVNHELLSEAKRLLTDESNCDNELRQKFGPKWVQKPSHELTQPIWTDIKKYDGILQKAMAADDTVKDKIELHKTALILMSKTDEDIAAAVPSGSISSVLSNNPIVNELTMLCEQAEALKAERDVIESELRGCNCNINEKFLSAFSESGTIDTEYLTDQELNIMCGELISQTDDSTDRQEALLANLQRCSQEFSHLKQSGAVEQQRDSLLTSLSAAYDGFLEVNSNLVEGKKFYADMTELLLRLQGKCNDFCFARKTEKDEFLRDVTSAALSSEPEPISTPSYMSNPPPRPPPPSFAQANTDNQFQTDPQPVQNVPAPAVSVSATAPPVDNTPTNNAPLPAPRGQPPSGVSPAVQGPPSQFYQPPMQPFPYYAQPQQYQTYQQPHMMGQRPHMGGHQPHMVGQQPHIERQQPPSYPSQNPFVQGYPQHPHHAPRHPATTQHGGYQQHSQQPPYPTNPGNPFQPPFPQYGFK